MSNQLRRSSRERATFGILSGAGCRAAVLVVFLFSVIIGCVGTVDHRTRFEHPEWGFSVPYPQSFVAAPEITWRKLRVKDADLAFRGPNDTFMAISSQCQEQNGDPAVLGRQLLVGVPNRSAVSRERFEFAGGLAFSQVVNSIQDDASVQTKTVTLVRGDCVVDWVLAAPGSIAEVETVFDLWWRGFDPGSMPRAGEEIAEIAEVAP
jgi:hypothetical protein